MKLTEIMVIKKDDTGNRLKLYQVDDSTLAKLTRIRGNLFKDDSRLKLARDLPTPEPKTEITAEMQARADAAYQIYLAGKADASKALPVVPQPVLTFEDQIKHDWRHSPALRKEFTSQTSYESYMRAEEAGKVRVYGRG